METITKTKERPILFSGPMVRAIIEGRKTMTRRIVKPKEFNPAEDWAWDYLQVTGGGIFYGEQEVFCRYGRPCDRLWVKETWSEIEHPGPAGCPPEYEKVYRADFSAFESSPLEFGPDKWRSPRFMPRAASRILLEIESVRVERLLDISEKEDEWTSVGLFAGLWGKIHGPISWDQNPWVWVIEFKVV